MHDWQIELDHNRGPPITCVQPNMYIYVLFLIHCDYTCTSARRKREACRAYQSTCLKVYQTCRLHFSSSLRYPWCASGPGPLRLLPSLQGEAVDTSHFVRFLRMRLILSPNGWMLDTIYSTIRQIDRMDSLLLPPWFFGHQDC